MALGAVGAAVGSAALGALGSYFGAREDRKSVEATNRANAAMSQADREQQERFAKEGIRWKVEDAKAAGLHPLYALGANTVSFAPTSIGAVADTSQGDMYRNLGQDISRSIQATRTSQEREAAQLQIAALKADVDGKLIDNQIRASTLRKMSQVGPAFPGNDNFMPGQGDSGLINEKPMSRTKSVRGFDEPGAIPDVGYVRTKTGLVPVPSSDVKERIEDNVFHEASHYFRNNVLPNFGYGEAPPKAAAGKGRTWEWSYRNQEWQSVPDWESRYPRSYGK